MDWSTSALMNSSPLARRLPGQRTPPDPTLAQPNAADITYGWHASEHGSSSSEEESQGESDGEANAEGSTTRQQEAAAALRQRRRERRAARRRRGSTSTSSSEGSIVSYNSATAQVKEPTESAGADDNIGGSNSAEKEDGPSAPAPDVSAPEHDSESFICRICFDGSGSQDEGGETLGKLIAPCRCRGTMKVSS